MERTSNLANKLTSGKQAQASQALVVQKRFIRLHLNYKTIKLVFTLFLMVREFDTTLNVDKSLKFEARLGDRRN